VKYVVIEKCYGFRRRLWEVGEVVDTEPGETPPPYFKALETKAPSLEAKEPKKVGKLGGGDKPLAGPNEGKSA
jgi:hypothetical protein